MNCLISFDTVNIVLQLQSILRYFLNAQILIIEDSSGNDFSLKIQKLLAINWRFSMVV